MKSIFTLGLIFGTIPSLAGSKVTCAAQIRAKVSALVRASKEFKAADPTRNIDIRDISLNQHMSGLTEVTVMYGSTLDEEAPKSEMDFSVTADSACQKISVQRTK